MIGACQRSLPLTHSPLAARPPSPILWSGCVSWSNRSSRDTQFDPLHSQDSTVLPLFFVSFCFCFWSITSFELKILTIEMFRCDLVPLVSLLEQKLPRAFSYIKGENHITRHKGRHMRAIVMDYERWTENVGERFQILHPWINSCKIELKEINRVQKIILLLSYSWLYSFGFPNLTWPDTRQ